MIVNEPSRDQPSTAAWQQGELYIRQFEDVWAAGSAPPIDAFLPPDSLSRSVVLTELIHIDLERRLRAGQPVRIEPYLQRYPEWAVPDRVIELILVEYRLRSALSGKPTLDEYQERFPHFRDELAARLPPDPTRSLPAPGSSNSPAFQTARPLATQVGSRNAGSAPKTCPAGWPAIPGYEVLEVLGHGGMGIVYKARQRGLDRLVAIKMILAAEHASMDHVARFRAEAETVARLQHPHIVQIHEVGELQGRPYFSMEYVAGGSLSQKLKQACLDPAPAAQLVEVLARAVHAAHQHHIIHRDLKPGNVLLEPDGTPKIADFGLAKRLDESGLTASGALLGTPGYMAPEQASGRVHDIGPAADVYALGAILYHALVGRPPFRASTPAETIHQLLSEEPSRPGHLRPTIPPELETICLKCLEKEPGHRYPSAAALSDDLHRFLAGEPISVMAVGERQWLERWARRFGYELLDEIGRGLTGTVYRAHQVSLNRIVALKLISVPPEPSACPDESNGQAALDTETGFAPHRHLRQRFRMEAEAVAQLRHANIVPIFDFGDRNDFLFFSMEYLEGGTLLKQRPAFQAPLPAARLMEALARAIQYAHDHGIIHRDLRPAHILLTADGTPKISDFGLLLRLDGRQTSDGPAPVGMPSYMAPEQVAGHAADVGPATDVYGLGAILYELVAGRPPFLADTPEDTIRQVLWQEVPSIRAVRNDIPPTLEKICLKCLHKDPHERYASALDLAEAFHAFHRDFSASQSASAPGAAPAADLSVLHVRIRCELLDALQDSDAPEALAWLQASDQPHTLLNVHRLDALAFIVECYRQGARSIRIGHIHQLPEQVGAVGQHLIIDLPTHASPRCSVLSLLAGLHVGPTLQDAGQHHLLAYFD